jgi:hypothetical protein
VSEFNEPWKVINDAILNCNNSTVVTDEWMGPETLGRVVACVNFCADIPTETLIKAVTYRA